MNSVCQNFFFHEEQHPTGGRECQTVILIGNEGETSLNRRTETFVVVVCFRRCFKVMFNPPSVVFCFSFRRRLQQMEYYSRDLKVTTAAILVISLLKN